MPKWSGYVIVGALAVLALAVWRLSDSVYATRFILLRSDRDTAYVLDGAYGTVKTVPLPVTAAPDSSPR